MKKKETRPLKSPESGVTKRVADSEKPNENCNEGLEGNEEEGSDNEAEEFSETEETAGDTGRDSPETDEGAESGKGADEEADARTRRLEHLFKSYPATLELLKESESIEIGEKVITFLAGVDGFARGSGLPREEIDASLRALFGIVRGYAEGTLDLDILEVLLKGLGYDRRLEAERTAAEERGRQAGLQTRLRATKESDGVPSLGSRSIKKATRGPGIFSLAASAR